MSLRKSAFFTVLILLVTTLLVAFGIIRFVLLGTFIDLEAEAQRRNSERVLHFLEYRLDSLARTTADWGVWDDTYDFIVDLDQDYIDTNLAASMFESLELNTVLYVNTDGKIAYGDAYDREAGEKTAMPAGLTQQAVLSAVLRLASVGPDGGAGVVSTREGPMLLAASPILTSQGEGPSRGAMVMGRYLDQTEVDLIAEATLAPLSFHTLGDSANPPDVVAALSELTASDDPIIVRPPAGETSYSYILVSDINGQPVAVVRQETVRDIFAQGKASVILAIVLVTAAAVVSCGIAIAFQRTRVISPLERLRDTVHSIARSGDMSARVEVKGNDEFSNVAADFNAMLGTVQKHQEEEVRLRRDLEMEIKKRSEYTRELVHELKTPITPILASAELLLEGMKTEPWTRLAANIYRGALDMNDRLDDLVDIARGEVGSLRLRNESLDIGAIIHQMTEEMSPLITSRSQALVLKVPAPLPPIVGDEARIRQILRNLISNATKYTAEGGTITVTARRTDGEITVDIQDTGRGITPQQLSRIFEPYARITEGVLERQTGLGLGLKLSKTLVELHGGKIWVISAKGTGSTFSFTLPISPVERGGQERTVKVQ